MPAHTRSRSASAPQPPPPPTAPQKPLTTLKKGKEKAEKKPKAKASKAKPAAFEDATSQASRNITKAAEPKPRPKLSLAQRKVQNEATENAVTLPNELADTIEATFREGIEFAKECAQQLKKMEAEEAREEQTESGNQGGDRTLPDSHNTPPTLQPQGDAPPEPEQDKEGQRSAGEPSSTVTPKGLECGHLPAQETAHKLGPTIAPRYSMAVRLGRLAAPPNLSPISEKSTPPASEQRASSGRIQSPEATPRQATTPTAVSSDRNEETTTPRIETKEDTGSPAESETRRGSQGEDAAEAEETGMGLEADVETQKAAAREEELLFFSGIEKPSPTGIPTREDSPMEDPLEVGDRTTTPRRLFANLLEPPAPSTLPVIRKRKTVRGPSRAEAARSRTRECLRRSRLKLRAPARQKSHKDIKASKTIKEFVARRLVTEPTKENLEASLPATKDDTPEPVSAPWLRPKKSFKPKDSERKRKRDSPPTSPILTGPQDLLDETTIVKAKPTKRAKVEADKDNRVPAKFSLSGPQVHAPGTLAKQLRFTKLAKPAPLLRPPPPPSTLTQPIASAATISIRTDSPGASRSSLPARLTLEGRPAEAEPPAMRKVDIIQFSPTPEGGYEIIQGPNPEWIFTNMQRYSITFWDRIRSGKIVVMLYGYTYAEAHAALNAPLAGVACVMISAFLGIDASNLKSCNPVTVDNPTPKEGPWGVLIYGLTAEQEATLLTQGCLAARISGRPTAILMVPVAIQIPAQQINFRGPVDQLAEDMQHMVRKKLRKEQPKAALAEIARRIYPESTSSDSELAKEIIRSVRVTRLETLAPGGIPDPSYNVELPPLSDDATIWHDINTVLRNIDYSSGFGPATITIHIRCPGCHSANHYGGKCTHPLSGEWAGPPANIAAIREKARIERLQTNRAY